jgi:hypothetical protein
LFGVFFSVFFSGFFAVSGRASDKATTKNKKLTRVHNGHDRLGRPDRGHDGGHHALLQARALLPHDARGVKEDHLVVGGAREADDAVPRRLRPRAHRAQFLPHERVD